MRSVAAVDVELDPCLPLPSIELLSLVLVSGQWAQTQSCQTELRAVAFPSVF